MEASRNQGNAGRVRSGIVIGGGGGSGGAGAVSEVTRERDTQGAGTSTSVNPTRAAAARPTQANQVLLSHPVHIRQWHVIPSGILAVL